MGFALFFQRISAPAVLLSTAAALAAPDGLAQEAARHAALSGEALGSDLYPFLAAGGGNIVFSPCGISQTLALLTAGAGGQTKQELIHALHWEQPPTLMAPSFESQNRLIERANQGDATLLVANGLWFQRGGEPRPAFLQAARDEFGAEIREADFIGDAAGATHEINTWVGLRTQGKIPDLLAEGTLSAKTRLALVNAVYFKGKWEHPFAASGTAGRPFYVRPEEGVLALQMSERAGLKAVSGPDCDLLELPYHGGGLSMVILLPRAHEGLPALEARLDPSSLLEWLATLDFASVRNIHVTLPRFKMTYAVGLVPALKRLGVTAAFDPVDADFSAISGNRGLHVSTVLHKAFIDVNEEGTEAAAATFGGMAALGIERSDEFNVDHPFLFLIRDNDSGSILFLGRVLDPRAI
jgi:serpin B